jgi:DNA invertase Pin-like site-specific DNA recombinase
MNKITPEHLTREAYVYVRQSTVDQLLNNPESRRRQYALVARARALGWENAIVIDDDLGRSGDGQVRPGFERLLAAISAGTAGAVLAIEASRLARNGRDWHTLLEFCAFVNSLIIDEDGIYDPRLVNDRLLLGLKGTFSELELSIFRQRSQEALRLKATRGDLYTTVAIGYRRSADDRLEQDPDLRTCLWCSASSARLAACASSPCGCGRRGLTCRLPSMVARGGPCSGARRATIRFIGC